MSVKCQGSTEAEDLRHIKEALVHLEEWIENEGFKGWDPHDALNSPLLKRLTFGRRFLGIGWIQLLKRSPLNLRPILGIPKDFNPKGMGLFLASYLRRYQTTQDPAYLKKVQFFAGWLLQNICQGYSGACWGYNFDWANRSFYAPAGTPTIVNTAFVAQGFLDLYELDPTLQFKSVVTKTTLEIVRSACDFILKDLNRYETNAGEMCFSYTPLDRRWVHNANVLGASLLARVYVHCGENELKTHALAAARFTASRQRPDGSWPYGESAQDSWVDNFHTGFVLVSLKRLSRHLETVEFKKSLVHGYQFWKRRFFLADNTPKYHVDHLYPIDIHNVAQAVLTFLEFSDLDPDAFASARQIALWGIRHMQDLPGNFHYQIHRHHRIKIPYMRWSQAWMYRALTQLCIPQEAVN